MNGFYNEIAPGGWYAIKQSNQTIPEVWRTNENLTHKQEFTTLAR